MLPGRRRELATSARQAAASASRPSGKAAAAEGELGAPSEPLTGGGMPAAAGGGAGPPRWSVSWVGAPSSKAVVGGANITWVARGMTAVTMGRMGAAVVSN